MATRSKKSGQPHAGLARAGTAWPRSFVRATWRNTMAVDDEGREIGVGFNLASGRIVRLRLDLKSAGFLQETILEMMILHKHERSQAEISRAIRRLERARLKRKENI